MPWMQPGQSDLLPASGSADAHLAGQKMDENGLLVRGGKAAQQHLTSGRSDFQYEPSRVSGQ